MSDVDLDDEQLMAKAIAMFSSKVNSGKAARKSRQKRLSDAVDGRSLRATGRTELVNFRATERLKALFEQNVPKGKRSAWMEEAILAKLASEEVDPNA